MPGFRTLSYNRWACSGGFKTNSLRMLAEDARPFGRSFTGRANIRKSASQLRRFFPRSFEFFQCVLRSRVGGGDSLRLEKAD
jgi:hypothetical protein